jgi:putative salt-induced outer membrane protein YdiY
MKPNKTLLIIGAATLAAFTAGAQTTPDVSTNAVIKYPWQNSVTAGLTLTRGNSQSLLSTIKVTGDKKTPVNEYSLDADGAYGSSSGVANDETLHGFGQWNHLFSERWYGDLRAEGLHDGIAELKYRGTFTAGAGYYFIKDDATTLAGEVGPGYVTQRVGTVDNSFATVRVAERGEHKFSANAARIWETVEYLPQVDKFSNYLVNAEVGAESALYKNVSLQICLDDNFNSQPAVGRKRNDVKLVSGITYNF